MNSFISRRTSHSWPSTWHDSTKPLTTMADTTSRIHGQEDQHHTSGDSIPVGFEASHLNLTQDSGVVSLSSSAGLQQQQPHVVQTMASVLPLMAQEQPSCPSSSRQDNFCPVLESTFKPVEPAKDPPVRLIIISLTAQK